MTELVKIFFELAQDEDGYPPVGTESVWARRKDANDQFELENVPFFVSEATLGDTLRARPVEGVLWFESIVTPSNNSLIRVVFFDGTALDEVNTVLSDMGCVTEFAKAFHLLAVSVPESTSLLWIQNYLRKQQARGTIDFEEAILRGV